MQKQAKKFLFACILMVILTLSITIAVPQSAKAAGESRVHFYAGSSQGQPIQFRELSITGRNQSY